MTSPNADPRRTLDEELAGAHRLLALLQQERQHLLEADIEKLERLTEEKAAAVASLFELAKARHAGIKMTGHTGAKDDMQAWLDSIPAADPSFSALRKRWAELIEVTHSAKELNRVNGLLIGTHMARNQTALNALRATPDAGSVYGPDGLSGKNTPGRGIVA